jgi:cell division septation protein DedD
VARDTARIPVDVSAGVPAATNPPAGTPSPASPSAGTGAAPSSTPSAGAWRVQIIAAPTPAVAERELARARKAGFDGAVVAEGGFHKVRLGGFATRADATAAAARVKAKLGGSPYVVRAP